MQFAEILRLNEISCFFVISATGPMLLNPQRYRMKLPTFVLLCLVLAVSMLFFFAASKCLAQASSIDSNQSAKSQSRKHSSELRLGKSHQRAEEQVGFEYVEDGPDFRKLKVPTYEWIPRGFSEDLRGVIIFVHGLTLHGKTYALAGKAFATGNFYAVSSDMRGFGRCFRDEKNQFGKKKIDYEASYTDLVELVKIVRDKHPGTRLIIVGESLGATPCLRLASQHPEFIDGIILSGPAVTVNPMMLFHPRSLIAGFRGLVIDPRFNVNLGFFMRKLVSQDSRIVEELESDPLIRKSMTIRDLLKTDAYVSKNVKYARSLKPGVPLLILQGSKDKCVVPKRVTKLLGVISSDDQTLRWMQHLSHLLLETKYIKPGTVSAIASWIDAHEPEYQKELLNLDEDLKKLGAEAL